ncbi:alkylation response protein AidB-like acyl-CoA dehydrogenase [Nocardioides thalensis]|uniref:Alkylation response protein AidB-like acyl-CoA dehydrogenase n=1 Tax=Nocardioides thalensis TaxID=1914755 RepID=A0A853C1V0_9ACTN|nr:acyl-CoA dehydrogenase [Nocardioides thalensis]NYJ01161.1 alkylation response protein AidB-like acyl-CoA dehydrogenase [Nocardioides thalensis]
MSIAITDEQVELAASLRKWAASLGPIDAVRAAEGDADARFDDLWGAVEEMGVAAIALPEGAGGGGGTLLDQAVALEACAYELVPGGLLGAAVGALATGTPGRYGVRVHPDGVVWDGGGALGIDLSARHGAGAPGSAEVVEADDRTRRIAVTLAAAEASGVARWCLDTAVEYAKTREQFGQKIGAFQAVKHLCAQMLETAEAINAAAWDASAAHDTGDEEQWAFAVDVAQATCFDGAVEVAKGCIQVLGGIGFTYEHDAHLYYRRALSLRSLVGSADVAAERVTAAAVQGVRRRVDVDLGGLDEPLRPGIRAEVERIAALPAAEQRAALTDTGYLTPHWPAPYGLGADPVTQVVIDQELARAGVTRPDLVIAGWAVPTILQHGTDEQRERFVRPSLLGELVWCQLFSEPGSGSDLASLRTRAVKVDGGWRLTGQKVWTSVAERADWGICLARTDADVPQHKGITYFLVDMRTAGIEVRPLREITGEALFNEVFLDDVFVPDECVVAEPGDGWRLARTTLANERVAMASARLGKSVERAVELAASRDLGPVQRVKVGHAVALATVCGLLGVRTTLRAIGGHGPGPESSVAKLLGVRSRQDSSELVVALQGDELAVVGGVARADGDRALSADAWEMLNTRCLSIAGGTTQILRNVAGERILGLPR